MINQTTNIENACLPSGLRAELSARDAKSQRRPPIFTTCTHLGLIVEPNVTARDELDPSSRRYNALLIVNL